MDWLSGIFRDSPSLARVEPSGLVLMLIGVLMVMFAGKLAAKFPKPGTNGFKILGLLICAGGALLAILG